MTDIPIPDNIRALLESVRGKDGKSMLEVFRAMDQRSSERLLRMITDELERPPRIAIIGKTGVGKSSTINALFSTSLPVSHVEACTQVEQEVSFDGSLLKPGAKSIIVYDMPGLGEDIEADERHKKTYARVLEQCDVAVWVLAAAGPARAMAYDQIMIRDVVSRANREAASRLVVGLNQIDVIQPGHWLESGNVPSPTQKDSIRRRTADIMEKLLKVCPKLTEDRIVAYSAQKRFNLAYLFDVMLAACPDRRAWVLSDRQELKDYTELIDPKILARARETTR